MTVSATGRARLRRLLAVACILGQCALPNLAHSGLAQQGRPPAAAVEPGWSAFEQGQRAEAQGDFAGAASQYEAAAARGLPGAMTQLAYLYLTGSGVVRDPGRALALFKAASDAQDAEAMFRMAQMYLEGTGVGRDAGQARTLLARAGRGGHQEAQLLLGLLLKEGVGGSVNDVAALQWIEMASSGRDEEIRSRSSRLQAVVESRIREGARGISGGDVLLLIAVALGAAALASPGQSSSSYDTSRYDLERQSRRLAAEQACRNRAISATRTAGELVAAFALCR